MLINLSQRKIFVFYSYFVLATPTNPFMFSFFFFVFLLAARSRDMMTSPKSRHFETFTIFNNIIVSAAAQDIRFETFNNDCQWKNSNRSFLCVFDIDTKIACFFLNRCKLNVYRPQTKLWEGNVFTPVCDSVHNG